METDTNKKPSKPNSILLTIIIVIISALAYGFLRTLFNTFSDSIHANHQSASDAALVFFIVIYIVSKEGVKWKRKKEDMPDPLFKRALLILELTLFAALVLIFIGLVLK